MTNIQDLLSLPHELFAAERRARKIAAAMRRAEEQADEVRENCRTLRGFIREAWPIIEPATTLRMGWHMEAIADHLEAISLGQLDPWIIINVPPGSSKSTIASVLWQAWEWGPLARASMRYVSSSFDLGNVKRDTRKTRDLILSPWFSRLWPHVVMKRTAEASFANTSTGFREGVAFKSITGKRGDRVIIDDPHSLDGAESETERTKAVTRFVEGGLNRTNDTLTSVIGIIMQRLHDRDLAGEILSKDLGFTHLMIPMEFEPARKCITPIWQDPRTEDKELMDPVRFPMKAVTRLHKIGDYAYAGQYQQRPTPRDGGMFNVDNIAKVSHVPAGAEWAGGWDFAGSKRKRSPFSVRALLAKHKGNYYIANIKRKRTNPTELDAMIEETLIEDGFNVVQSFPQDPGQAGKAQKWRIADQAAGYKFEVTPETGSKENRAEPFAAQVGAGKVFMVVGPWNSDCEHELRNFPNSEFKDQVDALSRAFQKLVGKKKAPENGAPEAVPVGSGERDDPRSMPEEPTGSADDLDEEDMMLG